MLSAFQKKWIHAGLVALVGVLSDVGAQLASGSVNVTRAFLVGIVLGGLSRVIGAILAQVVTSEIPEDDA